MVMRSIIKIYFLYLKKFYKIFILKSLSQFDWFEVFENQLYFIFNYKLY